ncbi:iron ABC transporter permease [Paucisalibacillus sp. EB02]|uniref:iron ABC transporter permease n=1 Tax=Paucisalibacillus sp. EB02 TaxID=1347087 RepID=UPI0004B0D976|nr:iron ABC transporter permease [Paucisalibacillus sp. EB02]
MNISVQKLIKAVLTFGGGTALLCILTFIHLNQGSVAIPLGTIMDAIFQPEDNLAHYTVRGLRLPRAVIGIVAGGALAVAGVILQTVTRNPLASASTLGIHSGTYFAVVLATVFFPASLMGNGISIAFLGGIITFFIVYILSGGNKATPVRMVLAGMIVSLLFSSLTSVLQIFYENETAGLFLWGSGTLVQNDWSGVQFSLPIVLVGLVLLLLMTNQLNTLSLGDDVATALGQKVAFVKITSVTLAVLLTAVTVSVVGPIGFVGLVAPHIIKLIGYRKHLPLLIASFIWGGNVLLFADVLARIIDPSFSELPVGSITALIGAPWLIYLVLKMNKTKYGEENTSVIAGKSASKYSLPTVLTVLGVSILMVLGISLASGNYGFEPILTWQAFFGDGNEFMQNLVLEIRLPRALVALLAGMALAVSGLIFQGVLRNPLADPSVIGITSGAGVGALLTMFVVGVSAVWIPVGAIIGAFLFFILIMILAIRAKFQPTILALLGIGISALGSAIIQILVVQSDLAVASALTWLSGSTYARGWAEFFQLLIWPIVILFPILLYRLRGMDILAFGDDTAKGLGVNVMSTRFELAFYATVLAAFSVAAVGTIGFVGLIAPHFSRLLMGPTSQRLLPVTALIGGMVLVTADLFSRTVLAPNEIPSGILVAIIGAPYFLWLMKQRAM